MTEEQKREMDSITFWHRVEIEPGIFTPGKVNHGPDGSNYASQRFALPDDLTNKSVLDIGCWDGYFSFEAEKRGASRVLGIDVPFDENGNGLGTKGFEFIKKFLYSKVKFQNLNIYDKNFNLLKFDVVLCYGVLYHIPEYTQIQQSLKNIYKVTREVALIETACIQKDSSPNEARWDFNPGFDNDPTNYWYPNFEGLKKDLLAVGFKSVEFFWTDGIRMTVKAYV